MPKVGDFFESYRTNEFVLEIEGSRSPGVTKITGLSEGEFDTIEQPDGGSYKVYKIAATRIKFESLTIERYLDGSPQDQVFKDWFAQAFKLDRTTQGGSTVRKNGAVIKLHDGVEVMRFGFRQAWIKSSKFTDLEAGATTLMKQTIVLEHEGLERLG